MLGREYPTEEISGESNTEDIILCGDDRHVIRVVKSVI